MHVASRQAKMHAQRCSFSKTKGLPVHINLSLYITLRLHVTVEGNHDYAESNGNAVDHGSARGQEVSNNKTPAGDEDAAATRIQARYRGYRCRKAALPPANEQQDGQASNSETGSRSSSPQTQISAKLSVDTNDLGLAVNPSITATAADDVEEPQDENVSPQDVVIETGEPHDDEDNEM